MGWMEWLMGKPGEKGTTTKRRGVLGLRPRDVVSYEGTDYVVESRFEYTSNGFTWYDYRLYDAGTDSQLWLSAEDDDGLELAIYRPIEDWEPPASIGRGFNYDNVPYRVQEHGQALVEITGPQDKRTSVEYWDLSAAGGRKLISVERWGDEIEASLGEPIKEYELKLYPCID